LDLGILKTLQQEWPAMIAAPWSVATIAAIALVIGFGIAALYYGGTVSTLRERVQYYQDRLQGISPDKVQATVAAQKEAETIAKKPLVIVQGKFFKNERVPLDGFHYTRCTFENVTLVYNGGPGEFTYNTVRGFAIASDLSQINSAIKMMFDLGLLKVPAMDDTGQIIPSNPVSSAVIEGVPSALTQSPITPSTQVPNLSR
jgi:hypothetical protein